MDIAKKTLELMDKWNEAHKGGRATAQEYDRCKEQYEEHALDYAEDMARELLRLRNLEGVRASVMIEKLKEEGGSDTQPLLCKIEDMRVENVKLKDALEEIRDTINKWHAWL